MQHIQLDILWHNIKGSRELDYSRSPKLQVTKTPNFSGLQRLKRLIFKDCTSLLEVDPSVGLLLKLHYLDPRILIYQTNAPNLPKKTAFAIWNHLKISISLTV